MKKYLKIVFANIGLTVLLIVIIDFSSMAILNINKVINSVVKLQSPYPYYGYDRAKLPNYENVPWASLHFKESREFKAPYRSYYGWRRNENHGVTINVDSIGIRKTLAVETEGSSDVLFLGDSPITHTHTHTHTHIRLMPSF